MDKGDKSPGLTIVSSCTISISQAGVERRLLLEILLAIRRVVGELCTSLNRIAGHHLEACRERFEPWTAVRNVQIATILIINQKTAVRYRSKRAGGGRLEVQLREPIVGHILRIYQACGAAGCAERIECGVGREVGRSVHGMHVLGGIGTGLNNGIEAFWNWSW